MTSARLSLPLLLLIGLSVACVPARKYEELNARYTSMQESESGALAKAQQTEAAMKDLQVKLEDLTSRSARLERDTALRAIRFWRLRRQSGDLMAA